MSRRLLFASVFAASLCASGVAFAASSVSSVTATLEAEPRLYAGKCPTVITFNGVIKVKGRIDPKAPVQIGYQFTRSDGGISPIGYYTLPGPGTITVGATWTLGGPDLPAYGGWEQLKAWPTRHEGGFGYALSAKAPFRITCRG